MSIANGACTRHFPDLDTAVRLLKEFFLNRTDQLAFWPPWGGNACPMVPGDIDACLRAHVDGDDVEPPEVTWLKGGKPGGKKRGRFRIGTYSIKPRDNTTRFLVIDCDGAGRHKCPLADPLDVALRILAACRRLNLPAHLERSGGGAGWHVWIFFAVPVPAWKARQLGAALCPRDALLVNGELANPETQRGVEVFPKQDTVAADGYGNLVWLPWFHGAAEGGNEFVTLDNEDGELAPFVPHNFDTTSEDTLSRALADLEADTEPEDAEAKQADRTIKIPTDREAITARARAYVAKMPGAKSGHGGHTTAFKVALKLVIGFALTADEALPILREYNARCDPEWSEKELLHKLASAEKKGRGTRGYLLNKAAGGTEAGTLATPKNEPWEKPVPLARELSGPPFPTDILPPWSREWAEATAQATQTPPDLSGMLVLALNGAALAGRFSVVVRDGWTEPLNLFVVVVLPPGERKSVVFGKALAPVQQAEREAVASKAAAIAAAASKRRVLEARLKAVESKAAKAAKMNDRLNLEREAVSIAEELASHVVIAKPQLYCDDVTPEKLTQLLATQDGRMLQAGAEGTAFEIAKGRYSETANFDVYLKGHAGDPLRTGRIGRGDEAVDHPALSLALTVQPDVVRGLAESATMRGRGFLARFAYSVPLSRVGGRSIRTAPVPPPVVTAYECGMRCLWELQPGAELRFSAEADDLLADFERWLEPQLAEELAPLAGWGNKLAGAVARVAGGQHVAEHITNAGEMSLEVGPQTVENAIRFGRDYLIGHAQAAFGIMGCDPRIESARAVLRSLRELSSVNSGTIVTGGPVFVSRRDIHRKHHRRFAKAEDLDPILDLLVRHGWLRPDGKDQRGPGRPPSPRYEVHPDALAPQCAEMDPR